MNNEQGFSLVEVLVAMTILAIGLLGVLAMQTTATRGNAFSNTGSIATHLAEEMVDRIRANAGNNPGLYNGMDTSGTCPTVAPAAGDCADWQQRIADSRLPGAVGTVSVVQDQILENSATVTVTLSWGDGRQVDFTTVLETWGS